MKHTAYLLVIFLLGTAFEGCNHKTVNNKDAAATTNNSTAIYPEEMDTIMVNGEAKVVPRPNPSNIKGAPGQDALVDIPKGSKDPSLYIQRGIQKHERGDMDGAVYDFTQAIKLDGKNGEAYFRRATSEYKEGKTKEACGDWNTAKGLGYAGAADVIAEYCK